MIGIITVTGALGIFGLWCLIRYMPMSPNSRLLFNLWASLEQSDDMRRRAAGGQTAHSGRKEGKLAL